MNRKQRNKNRKAARALHKHVEVQQGCDRCGMKEAHFIVTGEPTLQDVLDAHRKGETKVNRQGFYICPDLYDPVTQRRKDMSDAPMGDLSSALALLGGVVIMSVDKATPEVSDKTTAASMYIDDDGKVELREISEVSPP